MNYINGNVYVKDIECLSFHVLERNVSVRWLFTLSNSVTYFLHRLHHLGLWKFDRGFLGFPFVFTKFGSQTCLEDVLSSTDKLNLGLIMFESPSILIVNLSISFFASSKAVHDWEA